MSLLTVKNLSHGFGDKNLYKHASFKLEKTDHIGITGQNGAGKSTLLRILIGEVVPDSGSVNWRRGINQGHLDQHAALEAAQSMEAYLKTAFAPAYETERQMLALYETAGTQPEVLEKAAQVQEILEQTGFYEIDISIGKVVNGLGLNAVGTGELLGNLSGGQRTKVILAKLLLQQADVLLLDEPTNYLDASHITWLSEYLAAYPGAFLIISHDFEFLNRITNGILDVEFGTIKKYRGSYEAFWKQKNQNREDYLRQYHAQQREIARTEAYIRKNIAGVNTKMAQGRRTRLERMEKLEKPKYAVKPEFGFLSGPLSVTKALEVKNLEIGYGFPLLPKLNFSVAGGEKVVVTGFNGIGKSTLLKTLIGEIASVSGEILLAPGVKIGYYAQEFDWPNPQSTPLEILADVFSQTGTKHLRQLLARCGVSAEHIDQPVATLSGGEQSKVKLAKLLLQENNLLILDEPTNHFDAETKEALQSALRAFQGTLLFVSHEKQFYQVFANRILNIEKIWAQANS